MHRIQRDARLLFRPGLFADERHESALARGAAPRRLRPRASPTAVAGSPPSDRDDQPAAYRKLLDQRSRDARRPRRYENAVVGRLLRPAQRSASPRARSTLRTRAGDNRSAATSASSGTRSTVIDPRRQLRQDSRLVAGAGPDLQHLLVALETKQLRHRRHHQRLRDRLPVSDREADGPRRRDGAVFRGTNSSRGTRAIACKHALVADLRAQSSRPAPVGRQRSRSPFPPPVDSIPALPLP